MKRPIITIEAMQKLLRENADAASKRELCLPSGSILTPSAKDLARAQGVLLKRAAEGAQRSEKEPAPLAAPAAPGNDESSFAALRQAVLEKLPQEVRSSPLVDSLIHKAARESSIKSNSGLGLASLASEAPKPAGAARWRSEAGNIIRIDSKCLPWQDFTSSGKKNSINIVDVIGTAENAPWGVGYLEWSNSGFDWKLDYAEVDVILEGELHITTQGKTLKAKPGDVVFVPKGTSLRFESPGYVKFAYITWPADWSEA